MARPVLILDGAPVNRKRVEHLLDGLGCAPIGAEDARAAAQRLEEWQPLVTFADWRTLWGDLDGAGALMRLHRECGLGPFVLLADGQTPVELLEHCWQAGADDCILGPLRPETAAARIQAATEGGAAAPAALLVLVGGGPWMGQLREQLELCGFQTLLVASPLQLPPAALVAKVEAVLCAPDRAHPNAQFLLRQVRGLRGSLAKAPAVLLGGGALDAEARAALQVAACLPAGGTVEPVLEALQRFSPRPPEDLAVKSRVPFFCPVEFSCNASAEDGWTSGFTFDLSPEGVFIRTLVPQRPGTALELKLHLTLLGEELRGTGVVCWSNPYRQRRAFSYPAGMGVKLAGMGDAALMTLRGLCREGHAP